MMVGDITERITASIEIPLGILPSGFTSPFGRAANGALPPEPLAPMGRESPLSLLVPFGDSRGLRPRDRSPSLVSVKTHCNKKIYKDDQKDRVPPTDRLASLDPSDTKRLQSVFKSSRNKRIVF